MDTDRSKAGQHSGTSKTIRATCNNCQKEFDLTVIMFNGREISGRAPLCPACRKAEDDKREAEELHRRQLVEENLREYWRDNSGIPLRFDRCCFDNFKKELQPKAYAAAYEYAEKTIKGWPELDESDEFLCTPSLLLYSEVYGVGKTHLAAAIANHIIWAGHISNPERRPACPVMFTNETQLLMRIRSTFNHGEETEEALFKKLTRVRLLIIDDVGKENPSDYSFYQRVYFTLINERYNACAPMVLTSNLSPAKLAVHIGDAAADRLAEMCGKIIKMNGSSYRVKRTLGAKGK